MKKSTIRIAVIIICLITMVVGYYAYLSGKSRSRSQEAGMTVVDTTLSRDLNRDYPATPKEVMRYYNEILRCLYNEQCTDVEIEALGNKARELYDEELLAANELGTYMQRLKEEVAEYKEMNRRIISLSVAASNSVFFFEEDSYSFARISCGYTIMQGGSSAPVEQVYLLRRDENRRWKIYGWDSADNLLINQVEEDFVEL